MRFIPISTILALSACSFGKEEVQEASVELRRFEDCSEAQEFLSDVMLNTALEYRYGYGWWGDDVAMDASVSESSEDASDSPSDYTTTNVQEEGVDELDVVKTDGEYIYVAQDKGVHIVDSWPVEEAHKLASIEFSGWVRGLFLYGEQIVVLSSGSNQVSGFEGYGYGVITVVDISDRTAPQIVKTYEIEGNLSDARLIDGDLYTIMNHYTSFPPEFWDVMYNDDLELPDANWNLDGAALEADLDSKREEARALLEPILDDLAASLDIAQMLPKWRYNGVVENLHSCEGLYRPGNVSRFNVLSLLHLDLEEDTMNAQGLVSDGWTVYASRENLYVAQSGRWWWWGWGEVDMSSHIHKFDLNGGEAPSYAASGSVPGWLYDQFAMSEYDGHLRVASTDYDWWMGSSEEEESQAGNNITVLHDNGLRGLSTVGQISGIAPGERIFASRMMGDEGYMVTFRQVDPLYTLDLSDHSDPKVVGELKIPGYSAYLHPIDEQHLLAVGMDGEDDGTINGLAINLFDVSDFSNPQLAFQHTLNEEGWSWSESLWDHHAFTFHRGVLTIPAYSWNYSEEEGYELFSGTISFSVDIEEGITEIGRVDHASLINDSQCLYEIWYGDYYDDCNSWYYQPYVRRSLYIEDNLFSLSNYGLKVNDLNNPAENITDVLFYPAE